MQPRRLARTLAFQTLFELEARPSRPVDDALEDRRAAMQEETGEPVEEDSMRFARRLVEGSLRDRERIDTMIERAAPAFPVDQLPLTDRSALELAIYEMLSRRVPVGVAINEAVELAKTFGGENSGRFVNGVLGTIAGEIERGAAPAATQMQEEDVHDAAE